MGLPAGVPNPGSTADYLRQLVSPDWRERHSAIAALGHTEQIELIRQVLEMIRQDHAHLNVLSSALQVLEQAGRPVIRELIEMLNDPDRELRIYVPIVLRELGGPEVVKALMRAAADAGQPENVRFNAIEALGALKAPEAVDLLRGILHAGSPFLKYGAIAALGQIAPVHASEPLTAELVPFLADPYLAEPAVVALGQVGDVQTPSGAAVITGWLDHPQANPALAVVALAAMANRSPDPAVVRAGFFNRLSETGAQKLQAFLQEDPLARDETAEDVPVDPVAPHLVVVCGWLLSKAAESAPSSGPTWLAALQKSAAIALVRLLAYEPARHAAETALMANPAPGLQEMIASVGSDNPDQARSAVRLLARSLSSASAAEQGTVLQALLGALESEDETLVALAAEGLGKIGSEGASASAPADATANATESAGKDAVASFPADSAAALWPLLEHPSAQVRGAAVCALAALRPPDLSHRAAELLRRPDPALRAAGLDLLVESEDTRASGAVFSALADPSPIVRRAAVELLPRVEPRLLPEPGISARLETLLADDDPSIRRGAAQAAALLAPSAARPLLIRAAADKNSRVRAAAIRGLAQHLHLENFPIFLQYSADPLPPVRLAAVEGLRGMYGMPLAKDQQAALGQRLQELLDDDDEQVRGAARLPGGAPDIGADTNDQAPLKE